MQVHNVPIVCMSERMALEIGKMIGKVLELDGGSTRLCLGKFLRVCLQIDISKPLLKVVNIIVKKNERLSDFYFNCGLANHTIRDCHQLPSNTKITPGTKWKYKSWIRGQSPIRPRNRALLSPPKMPKHGVLSQASSPAGSIAKTNRFNRDSPITV